MIPMLGIAQCLPDRGFGACPLIKLARFTMSRVLYVEDNDDNVYMLKMRLELIEGFEIAVARDGAEAISSVVADPPDIILMDLNVPVLSGWEATRRLKADPKTAQIPIIALTAHAMTSDREKALAAGCDDFDTKPIDFERLLAKMRKLLSVTAAS
jgi:two-component system, cell cycle response regulator DivK